MSRRGRRRTLAPLVLLALSTGATLFVGELSVRYLAPQALNHWTEDPVTGLALLRPRRSVVSQPWRHPIRSNQAGFRDEDWRDSPGSPRVLVFGDSFVEAMQVAWEDTFSHRLEAGLRETGYPDAEVISAGISGWGTDAQLRYFERSGKEIRPDVVIVMFTVYNDVQDNLAGEYHERAGDGFVPRDAAEKGWDRLVHTAKRTMASRFHLYQLTRNLVRSGDNEVQFSRLQDHWVDLIHVEPPEQMVRGWDDTYDLLTALRDSATAVGAELALVPIPMEIRLSDELEAEFLAAYGLSSEDVDLHLPGRRLEEWATASGVDFIDLTPEFRGAYTAGRVLYLSDDGHWNESGHELAARVVSRAMAPSPAGEVPGGD